VEEKRQDRGHQLVIGQRYHPGACRSWNDSAAEAEKWHQVTLQIFV
jgi:2-keto-3-deoxy-L-rhamnonate aldolase RhmA